MPMIPPWRRPDNFSVQAHQRIVEEVNEIHHQTPMGQQEVFNSPHGRAVLNRTRSNPTGIAKFIITANETGGGKYVGAILNPPVVDIPATGDLSADELGLGGSTIIRACNVREEGQSTHDLTTGGAYLPVRFTGYFLRVADDGVPVYEFDGRQGEPCTP